MNLCFRKTVAVSADFALDVGSRKDIRINLVGSGMVRGTLVWSDTGEPALGLQVNGLSHEGPPAVDGSGRFEAKVPAGEYDGLSLQSRDRGFPRIKLNFEVTPGEVTDLAVVRVPR